MGEINYQTVQQTIVENCSIKNIESMLQDPKAELTDRQIKMLREELSDRKSED